MKINEIIREFFCRCQLSIQTRNLTVKFEQSKYLRVNIKKGGDSPIHNLSTTFVLGGIDSIGSCRTQFWRIGVRLLFPFSRELSRSYFKK